jgi:hypothetical protein
MQEMAAETLGRIAANAEDAVTIAASGAIPLLVQLLKPGAPDEVQMNAAGTICKLASNSENAITIAASGAIPVLVQLLGPGSRADVQANATAALGILCANSENAVIIAAAGAIPPLAQLLSDAGDAIKAVASHALEAMRRGVAENRAAAAKASADTAVTIATAGAIPPLAAVEE